MNLFTVQSTEQSGLSISHYYYKNTRNFSFFRPNSYLESYNPWQFHPEFGEHPLDARQQPRNDTAGINLDASRSAGRLLR